jgi:hypothetical protein
MLPHSRSGQLARSTLGWFCQTHVWLIPACLPSVSQVLSFSLSSFAIQKSACRPSVPATLPSCDVRVTVHMRFEQRESEHEMDPISQFIVNLLNNILGGLSGPIEPLINLIGFTPLDKSTANAIVDAGWHHMVGAADAFLGLIVIVGAIQVMYGQSTGTLYMPIGQFLSKAVLTVVLIHVSFIIGQDLIILNNELCGVFYVQVQDFIRQVNGGQPFNAGQTLNLSAVLAIVFSGSLVRVAFQAVVLPLLVVDNSIFSPNSLTIPLDPLYPSF